MHAGPELVHIQPLIGPHASASVNQKNTVVNKIPSAMKALILSLILVTLYWQCALCNKQIKKDVGPECT
ncbi:hypothetical protein BH18THE2_BH18THE2_43690 [soil metagenome]